MNVFKIGTWLFTHAPAIYALVMTAVHTVEQAANETTDKRKAAVDNVVGALDNLFNLTGIAKRLVQSVVGGMVEVYVGVLNFIHGHDWYGDAATAVSAPQVADSANTVTQATQVIRQTDVSGPSSASSPADGAAPTPAPTPDAPSPDAGSAPAAQVDHQMANQEGASYPTGTKQGSGGGGSA